MRIAITILALVLVATGCLGEEPLESEGNSELTLSNTSPALLVAARITGMRRSADELRAVLATTKLPVNPTWTDDKADQFEQDAQAAIKEAATLAVYEQIETMLSEMQQRMEDKLDLERYESLLSLEPPTKQTREVMSKIVDAKPW